MAEQLSDFEGRHVGLSRVAITNAGDGLSKALAIDPMELSLGDMVYVVLETEVSKIRFDESKDGDDLTRVHVLKAGTATLVDEDLVRDHLDRQAQRIEQAQGVHRLPLDGEDGIEE